MHSYEEFDDNMWEGDGGGGDGSMFLEVTPITFFIRVKEGISLSQLRLFYGKPEESEIKGKELYEAVLLGDDDKPDDECLRVNLSNVKFRERDAAAFGAKLKKEEPVKLWVDRDPTGKPVDLLKPSEFWELVPSEDSRFRITQTNFYILRSKEKILLRRGVCVYCRAIDETIGEIRIHYAGFAHPYFGYHIKEDGSVVATGTPLIFEVRGHDVNVSRMDFDRYTKNTEEIFAIELDEVTPFRVPIARKDISEMLVESLTPPQSYCELKPNTPWGQAVSLATLLQGAFKGHILSSYNKLFTTPMSTMAKGSKVADFQLRRLLY